MPVQTSFAPAALIIIAMIAGCKSRTATDSSVKAIAYNKLAYAIDKEEKTLMLYDCPAVDCKQYQGLPSVPLAEFLRLWEAAIPTYSYTGVRKEVALLDSMITTLQSGVGAVRNGAAFDDKIPALMQIRRRIQAAQEDAASTTDAIVASYAQEDVRRLNKELQDQTNVYSTAFNRAKTEDTKFIEAEISRLQSSRAALDQRLKYVNAIYGFLKSNRVHSPAQVREAIARSLPIRDDASPERIVAEFERILGLHLRPTGDVIVADKNAYNELLTQLRTAMDRQASATEVVSEINRDLTLKRTEFLGNACEGAVQRQANRTSQQNVLPQCQAITQKITELEGRQKSADDALTQASEALRGVQAQLKAQRQALLAEKTPEEAAAAGSGTQAAPSDPGKIDCNTVTRGGFRLGFTFPPGGEPGKTTDLTITAVNPCSPAVGEVMPGDRVHALNGREVRDLPELVAALYAASNQGGLVTLTVLRPKRGQPNIKTLVKSQFDAAMFLKE